MSLTQTALRHTCERQLRRLRDPNLSRHDLLNIATTLMLVADTADREFSDDVQGHAARPAHSRATAVQTDLTRIRDCAASETLDEAREYARSAALRLAQYLWDASVDQRAHQDA